MWAQAAIAAIGLLRPGGSTPNVSSSNGNFANQVQQNGQAPWQLTMGGKGQPPEARAFTAAGRADSFVMGLTGLSTTKNTAVGNGTAVTQPAAITNSLFQNPWMWGALAVAVVGVAWIGKR